MSAKRSGPDTVTLTKGQVLKTAQIIEQGEPNYFRVSFPGGYAENPVLPATAMFDVGPSDFGLPSSTSVPAFRDPGTLQAPSGPGRNETGQFTPRYQGSGLPDSIYSPGVIPDTNQNNKVNERVHLADTIDPVSMAYPQALRRGVHVFQKKDTGGEFRGLSDEVLATLSHFDELASSFSILLNLPTLNFYLACMADAKSEPKTVSDILNTFAFAGIIVSSMNGNPNEAAPIPSVVKGIAGPELVFNLWGNGLPAMTPVYFLLVMRPIPDYYSLNPEGSSYDRPFATNGGGALRSKCFQFVPWAHPTKIIPSKEDVAYIDEDGRKRYGAAIQVGVVKDFIMGKNRGVPQFVEYSMPVLLGQDMVHIHGMIPRITNYELD